jgi:hypothetical protein
MASPNYKPFRDQTYLEQLEEEIEEIDEQIVELQRSRKKLIIQQQFVLEDYTRRGRDV